MKEILIGQREDQMLNRGLFYGENLFTSFATIKNKVPFLSSHIKRLEKGLNYFYPDLDLEEVIADTIKSVQTLLKSDSDDQYIRLTPLVSLDRQSLSMQINYKKYSINYLAKKKLLSTNKHDFCRLSKITKIGNYAESFLAKDKVIKKGFDDFIKIGNHGQVTEASTSNIIFVLGDKLYSPKVDEESPFLEGVTLSNICDSKLVRETIYLKQIEKFEYCFLINSVDYLINVEKIDDIEFKKVEPDSKNFWIGKVLDIL